MSDLRILVAQIGARRHYAVPTGLAREGCLERLETSLCAHHPVIKLARRIPKRLQPKSLQRLLERTVNGVPEDKIHTSLVQELTVWRTRQKGSERDHYHNYCKRNAAFATHVASRGFANANTVYGFNAACLELFQKARSQKLRCVLDQTIAPWKYVEPLLEEERQTWPDWETKPRVPNAWHMLSERETSEMEMADCIICGSPFVVEAISASGGCIDRCAVVHYDSPPPFRLAAAKNIAASRSGRLKVLFAGTVCLRKGIQYLWKAADGLDPSRFEIRAVGSIAVSHDAIRLLQQRMTIVGSCSRAEMAEHYRWADVLVLPSLAEGSANVTYEAAAHGVPVITTTNAGSTVRNGVNGYVVPIRDPHAIRACLANVANGSLEELRGEPPVYEELEVRATYGKRLVAAISAELQTAKCQLANSEVAVLR
jgi:glycosyltransferase involved in cell wall biosynthesis